MKTNVIMKRPMGQFEVQQRTSDGYFDGNYLLHQWKKEHPTCKDTINEFINQSKVRSFIEEVEKDLGNEALPQKWIMDDLQSIKYVKGRNTSKGRTKDHTLMHSYLFIKFAMWINPKAELRVIKFVYDELIKNRHIAGDNYLTSSSAIASLPDADYRSTAIAMQWIVFNRTGKNLRQQATEEELQEIYELGHQLTFSINMGFVKSQDELLRLMRKIYTKKYLRF